MKLHEYQSKFRFGDYGIPIPQGKLATTAEDVYQIAKEIGGPVVVKSQVLVGGRGKAGGIKLAKNPDEAREVASSILGMSIKGLKVNKVLVDPAADIKTEIYLGITNDRAVRKPVIIASAEGGVEIEQVAADTPEKIIRQHVDPFLGVRGYQATGIAARIGLPRDLWRDFGKIAQALFECYMASDASLAEINPLIVTGDGKLMAIDGKMVIDDNGLFRRPELAEMRDVDEEAPSEREARQAGLSYVKLDGEIGCMVNGAGLAMATMDMVKLAGGEPANFLDIGGGAQADRVATALRIILDDANVKAVMVNIFGGITRCDEVAQGILQTMEELKTDVPMVVRLVGTNEVEGRALLSDANMATAETLHEAADKAVELAQVG